MARPIAERERQALLDANEPVGRGEPRRAISSGERQAFLDANEPVGRGEPSRTPGPRIRPDEAAILPPTPAEEPSRTPGPRIRPDEAAILPPTESYDETERLKRRPERQPTVTAAPVTPAAPVAPVAAVERPSPTATRVEPSTVFGGFPYRPIGLRQFGVTEKGEDVLRSIAATEGGAKGENQMNIPIIPNALKNEMIEKDKKNKTNILEQTQRKIRADALIVKGNIDVTTGKRFTKNLSDMSIEEVIDLGKRRVSYYAKLGIAASSASGKYGFLSSRLEDEAKRVFGNDWKKQIYDEDVQDRLQVSLFNLTITEAMKRKDTLSSGLLYMQHFFGPNSPTPGKILSSRDSVRMSELMTEQEKKFNPIQSAMTVGQYKKSLTDKGFTFDKLDSTDLLITPNVLKIPESVSSPTLPAPPASQRPRVNQGAKKTSSLVQVNNNVAVYNTNRIMSPTQTNNNPGLA